MHQICRRDFTDKKRLNVSSRDAAVKTKSTVRSLVGFEWKTNCFICAKQAIIDIRQKKNDVQEVRTLQVRANGIQNCNKRNDEFAHSVDGTPANLHWFIS